MRKEQNLHNLVLLVHIYETQKWNNKTHRNRKHEAAPESTHFMKV